MATEEQAIFTVKTIIIKNISSKVTADDLFQLLGLGVIPLSHGTPNVIVKPGENSTENYAVVKVPEPEQLKVLTFNGHELYGLTMEMEVANEGEEINVKTNVQNKSPEVTMEKIQHLEIDTRRVEWCLNGITLVEVTYVRD